jgi:hypothetical protein
MLFRTFGFGPRVGSHTVVSKPVEHILPPIRRGCLIILSLPGPGVVMILRSHIAVESVYRGMRALSAR